MPVSMQYDRSALLVRLGGLGYLWCLLRTGAEDAADARILGVRCFLSREARVSSAGFS
jgi:hypothetical protein